jgi:hypothetical protein
MGHEEAEMEKAARWCQACFEMRLIVFAPLLLASVSLSGAETQAVHVATPDADGVQRIRIVGGDYFFKPARIVVKANTPVELVVSKEAGMVPHNLGSTCRRRACASRRTFPRTLRG